MDCFIQGVGVISPQRTFDNGEFLTDVIRHDGPIMTCVHPDFKAYIPPLQLRRLGRMSRMGLAAAAICMQDAGVATVDAIITATGYGLQEDMAKFLNEILDRDEQQQTPTHFMQSSYNAMAGLLAISLKCTGYNNNFVSRGFAFETALHDAVLSLREKESENILLGAFDETSPQQYAEYIRLGYFKPGRVDHLNLFAGNTTGTLQGEGVAFFLLSSLPCPNSLCRLRDFRMVRPSDDKVLAGVLDGFLSSNDLTPQDIDVIVNGISGDAVRDRWNLALKEQFFPVATEVRFKHLTGEYTTASAFGLWLGAKILKTQTLPEAVLSGSTSFPCSVKTILFCNHFLGKYYSFFLLIRE